MSKRLLWCVCVVTLLALGSAQAEEFSDDFEDLSLYIIGGAPGETSPADTGYAGLLNPGGTITALDTFVMQMGGLYMESTGSSWGPGPGPLLYLDVPGDFVATVKVTDFAGSFDAQLRDNDAGILVRDPASDANDASENWVSVNYFPTWTGFIARSTTDSVRLEMGAAGQYWAGEDTYALAAAFPYIQIERVGSDFYPRVSDDGVEFVPLAVNAESGQPVYSIYDPNDPNQAPLVISRPDLPETLQVGLMQSMYTDNTGYVVFDDFNVVWQPEVPLEPVPAPDPVHSYTFEDGTARDVIGVADGNLVGGAEIFNGALVTSAQDQWMSMPGDVIDINSYEAATIEAWYTPTAGANTSWSMLAYLGSNAGGVGQDGWFITSARGDNVSRAAISTGSASPWADESAVNGPELDDGLLHHMVSTIDANTITLYIDGVLLGIDDLDGDNSLANLSNQLVYLAKGGYDGDPEWIGQIHEFNIYNEALSEGQVLSQYQLGPNPAPVHAWLFDDGTANDAAGIADGNLIGGAEIIDGALVTSAQDQWMSMPGDVIDINSYDAATIEVWYIPEAGANTSWSMLAYFGSNAGGVGQDGWFITTARGDNVSRAAISTGSASPWADESAVNGPEYDDGLLHHMVSTLDANSITLYIDGVLMGVDDLDGDNSLANLSNQLAYLAKGGYDGDPEWIGAILEAKLYNVALTPARVAENFAAGPGRPMPEPTHSWTFDDGTANDMVGDANGALVGGAEIVDGALVTTAQDQWMSMPGDVVDINSYEAATIEAWYTPTAGANTSWSMLAYLGSNAGGVGQDGWFITSARGDNVSRAAISTGSTSPWADESAVNGPELDDGLLHHMVSTIDATSITLYIDGVLMGVDDLDGDNMLSNLSNQLVYLAKGGYDGDPEWIGAIHEFNIYGAALTEGEVAELYAEGL